MHRGLPYGEETTKEVGYWQHYECCAPITQRGRVFISEMHSSKETSIRRKRQVAVFQKEIIVVSTTRESCMFLCILQIVKRQRNVKSSLLRTKWIEEKNREYSSWRKHENGI